MDLPKKKLRNTTWGVFKAYAFFFFRQMLSAGSEQCVYQWTVNGDLKAKVPCSPTHVFNVNINDKAESTKVNIAQYSTSNFYN